VKHFYYVASIRRKFTSELLKSWHNTLRRYERAWGSDDLAYVYGEQANIGLLAVAAEKTKAFPFIEFSTERGHGMERISGLGERTYRQSQGTGKSGTLKLSGYKSDLIGPTY
jgi:hypothetical protein